MALVEGLASFRPPPQDAVRGSSLSEQLRLWVSTHQLPPGPEGVGNEPQSNDAWYHIATQLPQLVLLFSSLDEAMSINLLTKRFPGLLRVYSTLRGTLERSGLFVEVPLDRQSDIGLPAVNAFIARLLLDAALPSSIATPIRRRPARSQRALNRPRRCIPRLSPRCARTAWTSRRRHLNA